MVDHTHDESELDEALPPVAVLEAYSVPDLPLDFTDRVMSSLHPAHASAPRPVRAPWIVAGVAMACAIAATALLVLGPVRQPGQVAGAAVTPAGPTAALVPVAAPVSPSTGDLVIDASPHDAIVRIDGVAFGESMGGSPFVRTNLPTGTHLVEVERDGYLPWHRSIDLPPRALQLKVELQPAQVAAPVEIITPGEVAPIKPRRPRPLKPTGSPDLKDPFGTPAPADLDDPFGEPDEPGRASPDMKDPFGN